MKKCNVIFVLVFLLAAFALAQEQQVQPVAISKISDRLGEILGGQGARGGVYIGDDAVLVIDAKMNQESVDQVIAAMHQLTDKPIKYLVNTHSDGDHVWGNQFFPETVTIIAHENCRQEFFHPKRDGSASDWSKPELAPFLPAVTFRDKMTLHLGAKTVELWYFGVGHTTGDIVVYFPEEKTAFIGDQFFLTRPQLIHSYKGGNSFDHVVTLTRMLETLDAEYFCSGHSDRVDRAAIRNHIDHMKKFQAKVKALVAAGKSLDEVKSEFAENEGRLVESVFAEVKEAR